MSPPAGVVRPETDHQAVLRLIDLVREKVDLVREQNEKLDARQTGHETRCDGREDRADRLRHKLRDDLVAMFGEVNGGIRQASADIAGLANKVDGKFEAVHARISEMRRDAEASDKDLDKRLAATAAELATGINANRIKALTWVIGIQGTIIAALLGAVIWALPAKLQPPPAVPVVLGAPAVGPQS